MSPEAQRIAIAEACGWSELRLSIPDYIRDLNLMHDAEESLTLAQLSQYGEWLRNITMREIENRHMVKPVKIFWFHATAAQRAEAFLRTVGKWEDEP